MPVKPPPGFITRPKAEKRYNRSQRALERQISDAYLSNDEGQREILAHCMVVTKEGKRIPALETSIEEVSRLVDQGKVPTWYVEEAYLEQKYGRKGEPKPEPQLAAGGSAESTANQPNEPSSAEHPGADESEEGIAQTRLPDDMEFLKERIRVLEREKREEIKRNQKREAELFDQLKVKDKQISAWDEVTQGLTRGLATGQLTVAVTESGKQTRPAAIELAAGTEAGNDGTVITPSPAADNVSTASQAGSKRKASGPAKHNSHRKNAGTAKRRTKKGVTPKKRRSTAAKPKRVLFPTWRKFLSR